MESKRSFR